MLRTTASHSIRAAKSQFHTSARIAAASIFRMPAMSPTMTEGGITAWKVKPGESFAAGDVLIEIETDKATIDVEAQDDGILWEILANNGDSGIPVGKPIAYLAEPNDDLATLEKPPAEEEPTREAITPEASKPSPSKSEPAPAKSAPVPSSGSVITKANPNQKLFPSVELLLHKHHISPEDAFAKIEASGPNGRLLKGDVLAYLGEIQKDSVVSVANFIHEKQHLDLSNIVLKEPEASKPAEKAADKPAEPVKPKNILTLKVSAPLDVPNDQFRYAFENSIHSAITRTYAARFPEFATSPSGSSIISNADDIFDDLLAAPPTKSRFQVYDISYKFPTSNLNRLFAPIDAFDDLMSTPGKEVNSGSGSGSGVVDVEFKVKFDDKLTDSVEFVEYFQNSLLEQIPSKSLNVVE
ncbi:pyridoxine biosynthesis protein [Yamadazyma tenuis]|uniref:Dihydrolipoamide dehydrogenase-binding protein of pyruvate dehydrogenase complex n=1 Tax=Candida tenuis (strain ATCC 10573 / BCRC 21748 / CBS 615 / JCM 9827 / NBRC 10315 / NRRL Y-1498 / VKM Y-70) TaxID=590646 RepID=G3B9N3_CANTC|nr:uncharacterized protein CANTEDRAFT_115384 [Yamadazyma tenuis ATCC 10573]XP_006688875.1 uncharacterized protein CANTEDRAFT_115384 [Yamadazyma tenuis ATCC 10573]EGV62704.1 hypothetical protein CANTEDRAFT_115384 [Yamadazyma tenuis ATCC 10573]EGV62705.1 hypothetical protein CANTEDRAFT_115384 [Yamadazyma tenuis ATCC 10573]WEJ93167.1 pyridoxine biosynthesis protein [Yamadazyma tenuis]